MWRWIVAGVLAAGPGVASHAAGAHAGAALEFKGGVNMAQITGDNVYDDTSARFGIAGGVALRWPIAGAASLQPELNFAQKGMKLEDTPGISEDVTYEVDYLEVPVLVRLELPPAAGVSPAVFLGPALGIELSEQLRVKSGLFQGTDSRSELEDFDLGVVGGIGFEFGPEPTRLVVDLRTQVGVINLYEVPDQQTIRNLDIRLSLGVVHGLAP
jgi:hypothetical protein